jgi:ADP-ribose pyrophosphatase YjhB (NUDIX family)
VSRAHPVWTGTSWIELPVPESSGEPVVVPNVNALVYDSPARRRILLQRRDKPQEVVRGRLELPGGRWRAGQPPDVEVAREVAEETGVVITAVAAAVERIDHRPHVATVLARPLCVVAGVDGAYPSLHVLFECYGEGEPRPVPGEVADPRWWDVDEVRRLLDAEPEAFVWHTVAMLRAVLGSSGRSGRGTA